MQQPMRLNGVWQSFPVDRKIDIGILSIADFIRENLQAVPFAGYQTRQRCDFTAERFRRRFLSAADIKHLNQFKTLKKQIEWLSGRFALKRLAAASGVVSGGLSGIGVAYEKQGAPYLVDRPDLCVSISHSGGYAAVAVSRSAGVTLGIDIEKMNTVSVRHVLPAAFTDRERSYLSRVPESVFYRCWTAKEAYLKYLKKGFGESLKHVEVLDGRLYHGGQPVRDVALFSGGIGTDYALSLVYDAPGA